MPNGATVAEFNTYTEAVSYVERILRGDFPAASVAIVGTDLRTVERVRAKINYGKVALGGQERALLCGKASAEGANLLLHARHHIDVPPGAVVSDVVAHGAPSPSSRAVGYSRRVATWTQARSVPARTSTAQRPDGARRSGKPKIEFVDDAGPVGVVDDLL